MSKKEQTSPISEMEQQLSIFGIDVSDAIESIEGESYDKDYVKYLQLDPQKNGGTDTCVVKLIPNTDITAKNIVEKVSYKIQPLGGSNFLFDSNKSLGWTENSCIVADEWKNVKDNELKANQFKEHFAFRKPRTCVVQVLKFDKQPNLVGSIMPLSVTKELDEIITNMMKPSKEDIELNDVVANNPFDLFGGNALVLTAKTKEIGKDKNGKPKIGRDFGTSKFATKDTLKVFYIPRKDEDGEVITETKGEDEVVVYDIISLTKEERKVYEKGRASWKESKSLIAKLIQCANYLAEEKTPNVGDYDFREPTEDRVAKVQELITKFKNDEVVSLNSDANNGNEETSETSETSETAETKEDIAEKDDVSDEDIDDIVKKATETK